MKKAILLSILLLATLFQTVLAQSRTVSGRVTDQKTNEGLPGVTILLKGTTNGVSTNADGAFTLNVPSTGGTLVFSSVGYVTQEQAVGTNSQFNLGLVPDTKALSEIVVTGYGTQERRDLTGSIATVQGEAISNLASPSFAQQLAGRAAGVQVQTPSALLGQQPRIQIRGTNSISSGTYPLVVVDGQPIFTGQLSVIDSNGSSGLADINPNDIESYEVLKDGSATAIYGSRAANGVILITTKHGRKGKATVTYDNYLGVAQTLKRYSVLNATDFRTITNEKYTNAGQTPVANDYLDANGSVVSTDWQNEIFRTGLQQNHALTVSGASDKTNYFFSGAFNNQTGVIKPNSLQRFSFRANIDSEVKNWLRVGFNVGLTRSQTIGLNSSTAGLSSNVGAALLLLPNVPARNSDGTPYYDPTSGVLGQGNNTRPVNFNYPNILFSLENNTYRSTSYRILANGYLEVEPVKNLRLRTQLSTDTQLEDDFQYYDPRAGDGFSAKGSVLQSFSPNIRWNWVNTATYNNIIAQDHKINAVVGVEYQKTTVDYYYAQGTTLSDRLLGQNGIISSTVTNQYVGGDYYQNGLQSYFGRLNYAFKDRYLASITLRSDELSSLAPGHQRGWFPGGSLGWRVSQEDFFKNSSAATVLTDLKLRASYARVGNSNIGTFPYAGLYGPVQYGSQAGIGYTQFGNDQLQWETSKKEDYGVDLAFFGGRITFSADYYRNIINGLILAVPTAPSLGVPNNSYNANVGGMYNKGLELVLSTQNIRNDNFSWSTSINFSTNTNKVTSLGDTNNPVYGTGSYTITQTGQSISAIWGFDYQGVNPANGNPIYKKVNGTLVQGNIANGTYYVYNASSPGDLTTTSTLSTADKIILGQTNPKLFGGFDNTFTFKGFDLDIFLRYNFGNKIMNVTRQQLLQQTFVNNSTEILGRWQKPGDITDVPRLYVNTTDFTNTAGNSSSRFVESGDFVRVQNITLGYTLPTRVVSAIGLSRVRLFGQVQNLYTFTKYKGVDPEVSTYYTGNASAGIDYNSNPQQRVFTGGLNLAF